MLISYINLIGSDHTRVLCDKEEITMTKKKIMDTVSYEQKKNKPFNGKITAMCLVSTTSDHGSRSCLVRDSCNSLEEFNAGTAEFANIAVRELTRTYCYSNDNIVEDEEVKLIMEKSEQNIDSLTKMLASTLYSALDVYLEEIRKKK